MAERIRSHMRAHGLQEPLRSAYWEGCSTESALLCVQNHVLRSLEGHGCHTIVKLPSENHWYRVRPFLDYAETKQLVHALVISRLDCYNCLLYSLPVERRRKLQKVQNACATLICRARSRDHVTPLLFELHWSPISARITYKILLLTYRALHGLSETYLTDLLQPYVPRRQLRSAGHEKLFEPFTRNGYGDRAFSRAAARLWNKLPLDIRRLPTLGAFKARAKSSSV